MSRDIPIIYSAPMVRAHNDDLKTMTRRLAWRDPFSVYDDEEGIQAKRLRDAGHKVSGPDDMGSRIAWPPSAWQKVKPGDRLWVREGIKGKPDANGFDGIEYLADSKWSAVPGATSHEAVDRFMTVFNYHKKRGAALPAIHMPRWASRLTLIVKAIKIERLQSISNDDVLAEGVVPGMMDFGERMFICPVPGRDNEQGSGQWAYGELWKYLHGAKSWDDNPEVVALSYSVIKANIDAPEAKAAA